MSEKSETAIDLWVSFVDSSMRVFPRVMIHPNIKESVTSPMRLQREVEKAKNSEDIMRSIMRKVSNISLDILFSIH